MNYISIENVSKSFGIKVLFEEVTFGIDKGDKIALVAKNGTGKIYFAQDNKGNRNSRHRPSDYEK